MNLLTSKGVPVGWSDLLPWQNLTNQQPYGFQVHILVPGQELDSADSYTGQDDVPVVTKATVVPECVHKHASQLPKSQQLGEPDALILSGEWVYDIFAAAGSFGVDLKVWVMAPADGRLDIEIPVRVHYNPYPGGDGSPGAAVWRLWVDDDHDDWHTFGAGFTDRVWFWKQVHIDMLKGEVALIRLQVESRSQAGINFFTDLEAWKADFTPFETEPEPEPLPEPEPVDYVVVVNLLPQDATLEEKAFVLGFADTGRETMLQSADDAARLVAPGLPGSRVKVWGEERWIGDIGIGPWLRDKGVAVVEYCDFSDDEPDPEPEPPYPEPEPDWKPRNYVQRGIKLGFHAAGDGGQTGDVFKPLMPLGAQPPTAKVIVSLGAARDIKVIDPSVAMIGRMIDVPGYGNVEGFDYNGDPFAQAVWHMNAIMAAFGPYMQYYDYIEVINEQVPPSPAAHVNLATFFKHCMLIAERNGFRLALFSHSVGTPEPAAWDAIANTGVFEMAAAGGHAISLHEYNLNGIGGCLYRYRYLYNNIILPRRLDIPLYITEYNVDEDDAKNAALMLANWKAYDAEVSRDPYVAGVHIYSTGEVPSDYRATIYSLWEQYRQYAIAVKDRVNG